MRAVIRKLRAFSTVTTNESGVKLNFDMPAATEEVSDKYLEKMANIALKMKGKPVLLKGIKYDGSTKRFYNKVDVEEIDTGFAPTLGGRLISTAFGHTVSVPSQSLAQAIALEWESQQRIIKPHTMPLMHLTTLALDQVPIQRETMVVNLLGYLNSDSACIRDWEVPSFVRLQKKHLDPVIDWMRQRHGASMCISEKNTPSVWTVVQTPETIKIVEDLLDSLSDWEFSALESMTAISKSVVLSLAIIDGQLDVKKGYECSRLEENFQTRRYGVVEGVFGHAIDIEYVKLKISAVQTFLDMLRYGSSPEFVHRLKMNSTKKNAAATRCLEASREYATVL